MGKRDPRVDTYIAKSAGFAQPVLEHFRAVVHRACPDVEETIEQAVEWMGEGKSRNWKYERK